MEELRENAKDYYNNLTEEKKYKAKEMFLSMDLNGDGSVSVSEYIKIWGEKGYNSCNNESFFAELDKNGDGMLDFDEFLSLYFLYKSDRLVFCDGHRCRAFLKGIYFTCVDCFNENSITFNICSSCYNNNNYDRRKHTKLLDNSMLLRSMAGSKKAKRNSYFQLDRSCRSYAPYYGASMKSSTSSSKKNEIDIGEAALSGVEVGGLADDCDCDCDCECSIM